MPTREAVEAWLRAQYAAWIDDPTTPPENRVSTVTFGEMRETLEQFWLGGSDRVRTSRTLDGYRRTLAYVLEYWGSDRIADLTPREIDAYVAALRDRGLSTSSIRRRLDMLSQLVQIAVRRGHLSAPPCQIQRPPLIQRTEPHGFSELETEALVAGARRTEDPRVLAVVLLAADAGLRREEMVRLHGDEVSLTPTADAWGTITVATRSELARTKLGHGRVVPILTDRLAAALRALFPASGEPLLRARTTVSVHSLAERAWLAAGRPAEASGPAPPASAPIRVMARRFRGHTHDDPRPNGPPDRAHDGEVPSAPLDPGPRRSEADFRGWLRPVLCGRQTHQGVKPLTVR